MAEIIRKIMIATRAFHPGTKTDISDPVGDLAYIKERVGDEYIGHWIFGIGTIGVRFPVKTTRPLTPTEADQWCRRWWRMGDIKSRFLREEFWVDTLRFPPHTQYTFQSTGQERDWSDLPLAAGWYYYDETWSIGIGPYPTQWEAEKAVSLYMLYLDGQLRRERM